MGAVTANTNGPRHDSDPASSHVMPALIKKCFDAMHTGEDEIAVWGDGKPTREFLCVDGYAAGNLLVTEKYDKPAAVNIGAGFEITIKDLANLIVQLTGLEGRIAWDINKPVGQARRCLDVSRAEREFRFRARTGLEEGLTRTIEWYRRKRYEEPTSND